MMLTVLFSLFIQYSALNYLVKILAQKGKFSSYVTLAFSDIFFFSVLVASGIQSPFPLSTSKLFNQVLSDNSAFKLPSFSKDKMM